MQGGAGAGGRGGADDVAAGSAIDDEGAGPGDGDVGGDGAGVGVGVGDVLLGAVEGVLAVVEVLVVLLGVGGDDDIVPEDVDRREGVGGRVGGELRGVVDQRCAVGLDDDDALEYHQRLEVAFD